MPQNYCQNSRVHSIRVLCSTNWDLKKQNYEEIGQSRAQLRARGSSREEHVRRHGAASSGNCSHHQPHNPSWATQPLDSFSQGWIPAAVWSCPDTLQSHLPKEQLPEGQTPPSCSQSVCAFSYSRPCGRNLQQLQHFSAFKQENQLQIINVLNELP